MDDAKKEGRDWMTENQIHDLMQHFGNYVSGPGFDVGRACRDLLTLREALRRTAVELGGYVVENGLVLRCLYCAPCEDACIACRIHTLLGDEEYMGKGGVVTEYGGLVSSAEEAERG